MEGGSPIVEWLTYGMVGVVLCALAFLAVRSAWFFLSLLVIPIAEAASRWAPAARVARRWGERGARRDPTTWRRTLAAVDAPPAAPIEQAPRAVLRGVVWGAALGALPGAWAAVRGALATQRAGGSVAEIASTVGIAIGLVVAAGMLLGAAIGAGAGMAWHAMIEPRRRRTADAANA